VGLKGKGKRLLTFLQLRYEAQEDHSRKREEEEV